MADADEEQDSQVLESSIPTITDDEKIFLCAVHKGSESQLKKLLDAKGSMVNTKSAVKGLTGLHIAAGKGDVACTKLLIEANARVDAADSMKMLPLHFAADCKSSEVTSLLLATEKAKAAIDAQDEDGSTALHHAAYAGRVDVTKALLAAGASKDISDAKGKTALEEAKERDHAEVVAAFEGEPAADTGGDEAQDGAAATN